MPKVGIAIDSWKYPIFERHLKQHGYSFEQSEEISPNAKVLTVVTENPQALYEVVKAANTEAAMTGAPK